MTLTFFKVEQFDNWYPFLTCSFKSRAEAGARLMRDEPMKPLERAVFWTEYVIRHSGANHLRAERASMPWFVYLNLDMYAAAFIALFTSTYVTYKLVRKTIRYAIDTVTRSVSKFLSIWTLRILPPVQFRDSFHGKISSEIRGHDFMTFVNFCNVRNNVGSVLRPNTQGEMQAWRNTQKNHCVHKFTSIFFRK